MNPQQIAVLVVAGTLGALVLLLLLYGRPRRTTQEPEPANFSKGDVDSVLEGPRLQRVQVWGVASAIFVTGFLIIYFVAEPFRASAYDDKFFEESVERGENIYLEEARCSECHGTDGGGGLAATDPSWPAPPLNNVFYRYSPDEISRIIAAGRENTPMPPWAIEFGGPLNSQKVEDLMHYLETIQVEVGEQFELPETITDGRAVYEQKCAICHGPNASGQAMGQPMPTYYASDLTTEFYRLGLKARRFELRAELLAELERDPTEAEIDAALAALPSEEIMEAGREASRSVIENGRRPTPMPQWQNRLRPEQIDAVVEYLASIQRIPN